jgi:hypothetical protein
MFMPSVMGISTQTLSKQSSKSYLQLQEPRLAVMAVNNNNNSILVYLRANSATRGSIAK